jgi:hypothetical protein
MELLNSLMGNALAVTILVIVLTSLIGFYVRMRRRDRCLRDLDGFQVTIETKDGHVAWGTLRTYATGVELLYLGADPNVQAAPPPALPRAGGGPPTPLPLNPRAGQGGGSSVERYTKHSYILYNHELPRIECFYRFHDHQSPKNRRRRERDIIKTFEPGLPRRVGRALRNVLTTFRDAIVQSLNAILGARAAATQSAVLTKHEELTASGAELMESAVGSAYDPLLEHYVGHYVVLEMQTQGEVEEEHGILKEYSSQYIELLNARVEVPLYIYLRRRPRYADKLVHIRQEGRVAHVWHSLAHPIVVGAVCSEAGERELDLPLAPRQHIQIPLTEAEAAGPLSFSWSVRCLADLIVPRDSALVRHAGKREKLSWDEWLGLDDLADLPWIKRLRRAHNVVAINASSPTSYRTH